MRSRVRSLKVPGSPSAALTTTDVGAVKDSLPNTVCHFTPVGNPAPPRPRRPEALTWAITSEGSSAAAAASPAPPPPAT